MIIRAAIWSVFAVSPLCAQVQQLHPERVTAILPVEVYPLASDSLVSSFLIYVNDSVPTHYHAAHSEHVYVLEGAGQMRLGDSLFTVEAGACIFIPKQTAHRVKRTSAQPLKVISIQAPRFDGKDRIPGIPPKK
jgi:mannose-6-phosphate isomerase-like protein (cupin superfamily)